MYTITFGAEGITDRAVFLSSIASVVDATVTFHYGTWQGTWEESATIMLADASEHTVLIVCKLLHKLLPLEETFLVQWCPTECRFIAAEG